MTLHRLNHLESVVSPTVLKEFIYSPKPRQLVFGTGCPDNEAAQSFDAVGCRRNAILKSRRPLPVFCPLDCIVKFDSESMCFADFDFLYIQIDDIDTEDKVKIELLPYTGRRFYWVEVVKYMVGEGIVNIEEDIRSGLKASGHVAPQDLNDHAINKIIAAWNAVLPEVFDADETVSANERVRNAWAPPEGEDDARSRAMLEIKEQPHSTKEQREMAYQYFEKLWVERFHHAARAFYAKRSLLGALGIWSISDRKRWVQVISTEEGDIPAFLQGRPNERHMLEVDGLSVWEFNIPIRIISNRSFRPIAQVALDMEQLLMAKCIRVITRIAPQLFVRGVLVDGVFFGYRPRAERDDDESTGDIRDTIIAHESLAFPDGTPMFKLEFGPAVKVPKNNIDSRPVNHDLDLAWLDAPQMWEDVRESYTTLRNQDLFEMIFAKKGCMIQGIPGVGKTYFLREFIQWLTTKTLTPDSSNSSSSSSAAWRKPQQKVYVTAYQHSSALIVGGTTLLHFLHSVGRKQDRWLIVDECSQVPLCCWGQVSALKEVGWNIVVAGDWRGQLPPVADRWHEVTQANKLEHSQLMRAVTSGFRIYLEKNRRCRTDPEHFQWYAGLYELLDEDGVLPQLINDATRRYPSDVSSPPDYAITLTNSSRVLMNALINEREARSKGSEHLFIEINDEDVMDPHARMHAQNMFLWPGIKLIGSGTQVTKGKKGKKEKGMKKEKNGRIQNGVIYVLQNIGPPDESSGEREFTIAIANEMNMPGPQANVSFKVSTEELKRHLRLQYAMTYHQAQGRTLSDARILIMGLNHMHFTMKHLIVGVSRVASSRFLEVSDVVAEKMWLRKARDAFVKMEQSGARMRGEGGAAAAAGGD